jgi:hypothetical protein
MRVTIVRDEGKVVVDGTAIEGLDLSFMDPTIHVVQWYEDRGEIELRAPVGGVQPVNVVIDSLDTFQPAVDAWQVAHTIATAPPPEPTQEEKLANQQQQAKQLLLASDWAVLPDVSLANQSDWVAYRSALRVLATTETSLVDTFPAIPPVIWA